ncbi:leucine-rich repeat and IQ domain-containing protein 4-like [Malaya genurostris]|uniref:leucine-rich repeat and IQ domain-containing protein 4-like n=1 Tax=Malaya genurostris TaxID=325434 RepID=UPI0026F3D9F0|nr:leucine-rich repeat and IQ domain-containing protein 4-like [Malaya genurostris]
MDQRSFISFVLLLIIGSSSSLSVKCNYGYGSPDQCLLKSLNLSTSIEFPVHENYQLQSCSVDYLSPMILDKMKWIGALTINDGNITKIYLKSDLATLYAANSLTSEIIIDDYEENDQINTLSVTSNLLKSIPKNLSKLKSLAKLMLNGNRIEYINFSELDGLDKLKEVSFSQNRIYIIMDSPDVQLNRLKTLDLSENYLTELDVINWKMPLLETLDIHENHLTFLENLEPQNFPSLKNLKLYQNLWDCRWRDVFAPVKKEILNRYEADRYYYDTQDECLKSTKLSEAIYLKLNITSIKQLPFKLDNVEQLETQIGSLIEDTSTHTTSITALQKALESQENKISELIDKIIDQRTSIETMEKKIQQLEIKSQSCTLLGGDVPKGLAAKLISEITDVILKNLPNNE